MVSGLFDEVIKAMELILEKLLAEVNYFIPQIVVS